MSLLLKTAKEKYLQSTEVDFDLNLNDFICQCYINLKPCSYGLRIEKKIIKEIGAQSVKSSLDKGDAVVDNVNFEIKASFLGKGGNYCLTHLRLWQKINFYLICLIDCENDFNPEFYVVTKSVISKLKLSAMNGTKIANEDNSNIEKRCTIKKNGEHHVFLKKRNKLKGNTFEELNKFIKSISPQENLPLVENTSSKVV